MQTVLISWELGGGLGHVMRIAALARAFAQHGLRVVVALADLADCSRMAWPEHVVIVAAPQPRRLPHGFQHASTFAELLYGSGYHDVGQVTGLVTAWSNLIELVNADIVVADHAPSAHMAARLCEVPLVRIGSGFFAPPPIAATPNYRTWESTDRQRADATDKHISQVLNLILEAGGRSTRASIGRALAPDLELISSWPELDCYAAIRPLGSAIYIGNEYLGAYQLHPVLPPFNSASRTRVIAYLKSGYPGLQSLFLALSGDFETIAYVGGLGSEDRKKLTTEHLRFATEPIDLGEAAQQADVLICHAGAGTSPWFLAAGKPVLLLPYSAEQMVNARMIEATGAGRVLLDSSIDSTCRGALHRLVDDGATQSASEALSRRWTNQPDAILAAAEKAIALLH